MDEDVEFDYDETCPKCGHSPTHSRPCDAPYCEDGLIDMYEDDPINFSPGEEFKRCDECNGTGMLNWCPKCGCDLNYFKSNTRI